MAVGNHIPPNTLKGVNMDLAHAEGIARIFSQLKNCKGVELLKYHPMGGSKMAQLGFEDNGRREWVPDSDDMDAFGNCLTDLGVALVKM
jgi:pyruvate-formate lyase-activating enzyme